MIQKEVDLIVNIVKNNGDCVECDVLVDAVSEAGIPIHVSTEEGQRVLDNINKKHEEVPTGETSSRAWTASSEEPARGQIRAKVVSYSDVANSLDDTVRIINEKKELGGHELLFELAKAFEFEGKNLKVSI